VRNQLEKLDDEKLMYLQSLNYKSPMVVFLMAFFLGGFGVDRFMLGQTGLGVLKILTCGGAGIWALVDLFTAFGRAKEYNYIKFSQFAF